MKIINDDSEDFFIIPNPIYDVVFKYLMEDFQSAKIILSTLLGKEIIELAFEPQEYTKKIEVKNKKKIVNVVISYLPPSSFGINQSLLFLVYYAYQWYISSLHPVADQQERRPVVRMPEARFCDKLFLSILQRHSFCNTGFFKLAVKFPDRQGCGFIIHIP